MKDSFVVPFGYLNGIVLKWKAQAAKQAEAAALLAAATPAAPATTPGSGGGSAGAGMVAKGGPPISQLRTSTPPASLSLSPPRTHAQHAHPIDPLWVLFSFVSPRPPCPPLAPRFTPHFFVRPSP